MRERRKTRRVLEYDSTRRRKKKNPKKEQGKRGGGRRKKINKSIGMGLC